MFFKNKKEDIRHTEERSKVEVIAHKKATKREIEKVKEVNTNLNELISENGFTLKIFLAAGGKLQSKKEAK